MNCAFYNLGDTLDEPWPARLDDQQFWAMVQRFSEPDGTFSPKGGYRSDNLVSNERSLQQILPAPLQARRSGAYLGVGPEQNFTYITAQGHQRSYWAQRRRFKIPTLSVAQSDCAGGR